MAEHFFLCTVTQSFNIQSMQYEELIDLFKKHLGGDKMEDVVTRAPQGHEHKIFPHYIHIHW